MKSLRARLFAGMTGSFALLLLVFGLILDASIEFMLVREFDFYLETVARALASGIGTNPGGASLKLVPEALSDMPQTEGELFSQYWSENGTVLAKSANLGITDLPRVHGSGDRPQAQSLVLPDGRRARAVGMRILNRPAGIAPGADAPAIIAVARDTTDFEEHLHQLRWLLLTAGAITMTVAVLVSLAVIHRSLKPLHLAAGAISAIQEGNLSARIPVARIPDEIVPLVDRLNELLERLEDAFSRERSLTADIAHELRTPVAGILSVAGVALNARRSPEEYREALEDVRQAARGMRSMIKNLLMIARLDSETPKYQLEPVGIREVLDLCWKNVREGAESRGLTFENGIPTGMKCISDRDAMSVIFANLLGNAAEHASIPGRIWTTARNLGNLMQIELANTAGQLNGMQISRVFDRFHRLDAARTDTTEHAGLGLAIVRRLVTTLGGTIEARTDNGNFILEIRLPAVPPSTGVG